MWKTQKKGPPYFLKALCYKICHNNSSICATRQLEGRPIVRMGIFFLRVQLSSSQGLALVRFLEGRIKLRHEVRCRKVVHLP